MIVRALQPVMPAQAGIQSKQKEGMVWTPAFAGVTMSEAEAAAPASSAQPGGFP